MPGYKTVIPVTFTDTTLPMLRADPILTPGSLVLIDPSHPAGAWVSGVPANGYAVPNIAAVEAATIVGAAIPALPLTLSGAINNNTKGKVERTARGGLHGIVSQASALASGDGVTIAQTTDLQAYLAANQAHRFYMSLWGALTRANTGMTAAASLTGGVIGGSTNFNVGYIRQDVVAVPGTLAGSRTDPALNNVGNRFVSLANGANHTMDSSAGARVTCGPCWGAPPSSYNNAVLATRNLNWPSHVFYRFYLEDLTVSGRTYAAVDAADHALYQQEVVNPGGRYYGDTYTNPSTIP